MALSAQAGLGIAGLVTESVDKGGAWGLLGPVGAAYGGRQKEKKQQEAMRPKNRRLSAFQGAMGKYFDRRQRAMYALAQSKLDFAGQF